VSCSTTSVRLSISESCSQYLTFSPAAGHETTAITLTYFVHRLSKHPNLQNLLRQELFSLPRPLVITRSNENPTLPSLRDLDALPLLQALIQETLRVTPPIPGAEPRITPPAGCFLGPSDSTIGQYYVPGNVRISATPYALHRNSHVFPEAEKWRPDRWLDDQLSSPGSVASQLEKKERWWWAFSSGGRMCIGSNFAMLEMKMLIAALYTTFKTTLVENQEEQMTPMDGYMGGPKGNKLWVKIERWDEDDGADSAVSMRSVEMA
jgi:cytochrome P450